MSWYPRWRRRPARAADPVGDRLAALAGRLGPARERAAADPARSAELSALERSLRSVLHDVRFEAPGYRQVRLGAALDRATDTLRAVGIQVDREVDVPQVTHATDGRAVLDGLEPRASDALGWVLRECTANILRHSTADRVRIAVRVTGRDIRLAIANNGVPPARPDGPDALVGGGAGSGLPSMLTQVSVLGGTLRAEHSGTVFEIVARVPAHGPPADLAPAPGASRQEEDLR
ncbi:sensor histidine kinase [Kitasatospora aureofaciens]|uniref:sensor histidine kinase n=1 Tax=Kitasatospora aureofaciens TaxID=1894 RepID=UPI003820D36A